jgi:hypothetical protein
MLFRRVQMDAIGRTGLHVQRRIEEMAAKRLGDSAVMAGGCADFSGAAAKTSANSRRGPTRGGLTKSTRGCSPFCPRTSGETIRTSWPAPAATSWGMRLKRDFRSLVPSMMITASNGAWLSRHGSR